MCHRWTSHLKTPKGNYRLLRPLHCNPVCYFGLSKESGHLSTFLWLQVIIWKLSWWCLGLFLESLPVIRKKIPLGNNSVSKKTKTMPDLGKQECHVRQHTVTRLMIIELREEVTSITHKTLVVFVRHTWGSRPVPFLCWNKAGFRPSPDCLD